ncbi:MAG: sigma-70 family RNA polymerase sigma factor [Thermoleophilaceae bacterium]
MHTLSRPADDEIAYRDYERSVLAMLATRYCDLDPDGRRELYHEAWASVLKRRSDGADIENLRSYLMGAADKLASKRIYGADARRRQTFDPTSEGFVALAGTSEPPDERVLAEDEARRLHMLIDELEEADRALLKLRLDLGLDPPEIRERLGLSERQYRRIAERAGKALLAQFRAFDRGTGRGASGACCARVSWASPRRSRGSGPSASWRTTPAAER